MFPSSADIKDSDGNALVTSYAVRRPDGNWSLMLVNRDENNPHAIRVVFVNGAERQIIRWRVELATFGSEQYVWINDGPNSHADPDGPIVGADYKREFANHVHVTESVGNSAAGQGAGARQIRTCNYREQL